MEVAQPKHPIDAMTTYELRDYRRDLEHAIKGIANDAPVQATLKVQLGKVVAEQESRASAAKSSR